VAEWLAPRHVRQVDLDCGQLDREQRIAERHAGVRVRPRVDDDAVLLAPRGGTGVSIDGGDVTLNTITVSGNRSGNNTEGAAVTIDSATSVTITGSTFSDNRATAGGLLTANQGGCIVARRAAACLEQRAKICGPGQARARMVRRRLCAWCVPLLLAVVPLLALGARDVAVLVGDGRPAVAARRTPVGALGRRRTLVAAAVLALMQRAKLGRRRLDRVGATPCRVVVCIA
jgi:hypothetical protein